MRPPVKHIVCAGLLFVPALINAQEEYNNGKLNIDDTNFIYTLTPIVCKGIIIEKFIKEDTASLPVKLIPGVPAVLSRTRKEPLIFLHGNVLYDFNYRSYIDTPLALKDVSQHYIQSTVNVIYANKYPVDIVLRRRQGNNIYLRNYFDINVFFNGETFKELAKQKVLYSIEQQFGVNELQIKNAQLLQKSKESFELNEWLSNQQNISKYLEYKTYLDKLPGFPADLTLNTAVPELNLNTVTGKFTQVSNIKETVNELTEGDLDVQAMKTYVTCYEGRLGKFNQLKKEAEEAKLAYEKRKAEIIKTKTEAKNAIHSASSGEELRKLSEKYGFKTDSLKKSFRLMEGLKSFGVGRSFVDYSELTVKNVSINGFHAEYAAKNYYAFAAGTVDYRFRDFMPGNAKRGPQYVTLVRYGKVLPSKNQLIFTAYRGRKYAHHFSDSISAFANVYGFSIESRVQLNANTWITGELAKSSFAALRTNADQDKSGFNIKDRTTTAVYASFYSLIRKTKTKIRANYRYQGANFQSFTIYFNQNNSVTWSVLADQSLFKNKLIIQAGMRKNEFTSPLTAYQYNSNAVFKSVQASLRLKRLPFVTVAYMPSSQLSVVDNRITENQFYTFTSTASHYFKLGKFYATSLAMYSRFYNSSTDTGFIYYNSKNIHLNQSFTSGRFMSNSTFTMMVSPGDQLYTCDQGITFIRSFFTWGVGMKYSDLNHTNRKMGIYGSGTMEFRKLNTDVNLSFEHGYLPGSDHNLVANDMGRIMIVKRF
jgi:hypothetical protein